MTTFFQRASFFGSVVPIGIGCTVLLGYFLGNQTLKAVVPGLVAMNPLTAVLIILSGTSLLFLRYERDRAAFRRVAFVCGLVVFILGFLKTASIVLGYDLHLDGLLFSGQLNSEAFLSGFQNRIAPNTSFSFLCIGVALMFLHKKNGEYVAHGFSLVILFSAFVVLLGYFYGVRNFIGLEQYIPMAMNTAIAFISLSIAVLSFRPTTGIMSVVVSETVAGTLMRRLILAEVVFPATVGYFGLKAAETGILTYSVALPLIIVTNMVIFISLYWWAAYELDQKCKQLKALYQSLELKIAQRTRKLAEKVQEAEAAQQATLVALQELKAEEEQVLLEKIKYESLFQCIGDAVVATDRDGNVTVINKTVESILGYTLGDVRGMSVTGAVCLEDLQGNVIPAELRPVALALSSGKATIGGQYILHRKDGVRVPIVLTVTPMILDEEIIGAVLIFRDTRKEREIDKQKTEFVSLASHQLRGPLTTISWYAEMILHGDAGKIPPEQEKYLQEIYRGNGRMIELVDALLDVSRIELGTLNMNPVQADIITVAREVLGEQKEVIHEKGLKIRTQFEGGIPMFLADQKFLHIALQNILANAVKYTPNGGNIQFTISLQDAKTVLIQIADTGCGIPKNQQDKIFTKFFRADNVKDRDLDGTGLGLYIAKSVVENSGGKIWFLSPSKSSIGGETVESPGTEFFITLPLRGAKQYAKK